MTNSQRNYIAFEAILISLILFALSFMMGGCGDAWVIEKDQITECKAKPIDATRIDIVCSDGTVSHLTNGLPGDAGRAGVPGPVGTPGIGVVSSMVPATLAQCPNGGSVIALGQDTDADGVLEITDANIQTAVICNGVDGTSPAPGLFNSVSTIQPCGKGSSPFKEVLLCLYDGSILSSFSDNANGKNTRFSFLSSGSYADTDDSNCQFSVTVNPATGSSVVLWAAGSNQYGSWPSAEFDCASQEVPFNGN